MAVRGFVRGTCFLALGLLGTMPALAGSPVRTSDGLVVGAQKGGTIAYLGIPYAAPPVGAARWRPPAAPRRWRGVRQAIAFGPSCPQILNPPGGRPPWTPEYLIPGQMSEDCLSLNVWRPARATRGAAVLFWLHGGGAVEGSASVPVYDGAALARRGIIVVTVNYRLGALGFLAHPELSAEQGGTSGNYALLDMIAALKWVHRNVHAFGGDPARVTIAGQSAGAGAVNALIASRAAAGLFARTITESGSQWPAQNMPATLSAAEAQGKSFAAYAGADSLADLRALPADRVIEKGTAFAAAHGRFAYTIAPGTLPEDPMMAQSNGHFADMPAMSGYNWDEQSGMDKDYGAWSAAAFAARRDALFGPWAARAAALYPAGSDAEAGEVGKTMMRERYRWGAYEWAGHRAAVSRAPIYIYFFRHPEPGPTQTRYGTFHSSEIPYVFGNLDAPRPFTAADRRVSAAMTQRWVAFIKGGTPNGTGLAQWPAFDHARPRIMVLGDHEGAAPVVSADKLRFADELAASALAPR